LASSSAAFCSSLPYIDQSKIRLSIAPGEKKFGELFVENPTDEPRSMRLYLEDWHYVAPYDGAKEFLPFSSTKRSCARWINFSPAEFTIPPFGKQRVSYSLRVPEGASGGYIAALFFETSMGQIVAGEGDKAQAANIDLKIRIATLFYVEADATVRRLATIDTFSAKTNERGELSISMNFRNSGNTDITTASSYYIMSDDGLVVARGELNNAYTLPDDRVSLSALWTKPLPEGEYSLVVTLDIGKALENTKFPKPALVTKESRISVGPDGKILSVGPLQ